MELLTNWYGLKDGGLNWFDEIRNGLLDRGFEQSQIDSCLFTRWSLAIVLYVDDVIVIAKKAKDTQKLINSLKNGTDIDTGQVNKDLRKFIFIDDGSIKTFLGVNVERTPEGFHLAQPHLIARILEVVNLESTDPNGRNTKDTPVTKPLLIKDNNGEERKLPWNYRSVVGMLNYLAGSTRPDLAMSVHQVARFCANPKRSYEKGIMRIA